MTNLHLLVTDLRHAELCVLGCKFVVRQYQVRVYPKHLAGLSRPCSYILQSRIPPIVAIAR